MTMTLYGYWRSSATYRVRIAMALKGLSYETRSVNLLKGDQKADAFADVNPQKLLPTLVLETGETLTQSMAILEYLEVVYPDTPLLPSNLAEAAKARSFSMAIAADIHPIQNISVFAHLKAEYAATTEQTQAWAKHWMQSRFPALEQVAANRTGQFLFGDAPGMAECCLIPQLYNARRFNVELDLFPALQGVDALCAELEAFKTAHPDRQPDAPTQGVN